MDYSNYTVIKDSENEYLVVSSENIERNAPLHNAFNSGIRWTCSDAGDYSLYNADSDAGEDMIKAGAKIFGTSFLDLEYDDNYCNDYLSDLDCNFVLNLEEIGLESKEEEIRTFIKNWEENNAEYVTCDCLTYWDGHNHNTIILNDDSYEELDERERIKFLKIWEKAEKTEWEEVRAFQTMTTVDGFDVYKTNWVGRFEIVSIKRTEICLEDIAEANGLDLIETTPEANGYPSHLKYAIVGFDSFEDAQKIADKYCLSIEYFQKRDGWQLWYRNGNTAYEDFEMSDDTFGCNTMLYYKQDIKDFKENEIDAFIDEYEDEEERENFVNDKMEILEHLRTISEDEAVLTKDGAFVDVIKQHVMGYYEDVYTYAIGLIKR